MAITIDHTYFKQAYHRPGIFLIVLNGPSQVDDRLMDLMLQTRPVLILADGGAKRYRDYLFNNRDQMTA